MSDIIKDTLKIIKSGYFDYLYYYNNRPDVLAAGVDGALHYLQQGWREGVNPSAKFSNDLYLQNNKTDICPLLDYINNGCVGNYGVCSASEQEIKKYLKQKKYRSAKTVCYTYISNGYDELLSHKYINPDWDYICFTNNKNLLKHRYIGIWRIKKSKQEKFDVKRNSGWHKTHPEITGRKYKSSIWIDGNVNILTSYLSDTIKKTKQSLLVPIHYERNCIYDECDAVKTAGRDTDIFIEKTREFLLSNNMPKNYGLNETNIVFRKHTDKTIQSINKLWWKCIKNYSKRDQLSFSYCLYKHGIIPSDIAINNTRTDKQNFFVFNHTSEKQMKKYNIIYSIGRDCACSFYLQTNKLRTTSGPMDWITTADFKQRFDMLLNDFEDFMNPKYFEFLPKNPNVFNDEKCDYYRNRKTGFDFYHDFPINIDFKESFPSVAEKYNRRIKRFYKNIKENNKVLLVWFSHYTNTNNDVIIDLCKKFCKKMKKNIDFLIIEHTENLHTPQKTLLAKNIIKWNLHTRDIDGTDVVNGNKELVNTIFQNYQIKTTNKTISYWIKIHILCSLIPIKKWRHNARKHINRKYYK